MSRTHVSREGRNRLHSPTWAISLALITGGLLVSACGTATLSDTTTEPAPAAKTVEAGPLVGVGDTKYPADSLTDWATYADYVAVVKAVTETTGEPQYEADSKTEYVLPRRMGLAVTQVLWSRRDAPKRLPDSIDYPVMGQHVSVAQDGTITIAKFVASGFPRIESGHEYLMPVYWDDTCVRLGPAWSSLGEVPFDGGQAGVGEFEGRERTEAEATQPPDNASLAERPLYALAGLTADQIAERLASTRPDPKPFVPAC